MRYSTVIVHIVGLAAVIAGARLFTLRAPVEGRVSWDIVLAILVVLLGIAVMISARSVDDRARGPRRPA